jgi:hypothetical protein
MPTTDPLFLLGYTIVIYIYIYIYIYIHIHIYIYIYPPLSVFCVYDVDTIFFMLLHFYNIKIKLKLIFLIPFYL